MAARKSWRHHQAEVGSTVGRIHRIFDRDRVCGRILPVIETGDAEHPVPVGASRIAAEGMGDQFECLFLALEIEAGDSPERLVFARRCRKNGGRRG